MDGKKRAVLCDLTWHFSAQTASVVTVALPTGNMYPRSKPSWLLALQGARERTEKQEHCFRTGRFTNKLEEKVAAETQ